MSETYTCSWCQGVFETMRSDEEAAEEAYALFGLEDAANNPGAAIVCHDCWLELVPEQKRFRSVSETLW